MLQEYLPLIYSALTIIWINIMLSGDNALVIALVCEELPAKQRQIGMLIGTVGAAVARVVLLLMAAYILAIPGLHIVGGLFLFYVAYGLVKDAGDDGLEPKTTLWEAIIAIIIADVTFSLDNVLAVTAAAKGNAWLAIFGVVTSMPIIFFGATILEKIIERFPVLVYAGAILVTYIGFETIADDPYLPTIITFVKGLVS